MRYPASEKLEIIRLVEQSHLPVRRTLEKLGIQPARFYRWYDRLQTGGLEALEDKASRPTRVWNRIPDAIRERIVQLALDEPELSPRELATRFTDTANYFVSEASVYRLLKAHDLITSPAYIVMKAADEFKDKTTAPNQLWQTDFTYLKVTGWGWFYLSTVLDDFSRYIIAWKLCTTMKAQDVTDTLDIALTASGCDQARIIHKPRLLSDNGSSYVSSDLAEWLDAHRTWGTFAALPTIRRHRARSNAGIRRSRTASCWKTTTCLAILKPTSKSSSIITITDATTRA
jgi:transposase InsO family protein